ncbi:hypothetical protein SERLADRAFT_433275 [Serpula lacrymans var. lacrymans S7.9]|uniref:Uncharacterized protein n=1 Tax=Serpula lacrymans var. lacrymans (strain S7.9) TaxID=578457 RepID=F8NIC3_SERL9|nr:uncharacterized protein SERLADRAFT_433275 [Serpula lacrymans var. lacrymans S7.9]EGO29269.1 hypothetical protein SERLADRAFT_433275 [Serpula lacrymans var. lacrymans S7.9]
MAIRYPNHPFAMQYGHPGMHLVVQQGMQGMQASGHLQMPIMPIAHQPSYTVITEPASQRHKPHRPSSVTEDPPTSLQLKVHSNAEPQPGAFVFMTDIRHIFEMLNGPQGDAQLVYKISGDTGKQSHISNRWDFKMEMEQLSNKAWNAQTQAVTMEIPLVTPTTMTTTKKKQTREDDVPPVPSAKFNGQLKVFKQLEQAIKCEA